MHFLIATAALLSAATLATANPIGGFVGVTTTPSVKCRIVGTADGVTVRDCPSRKCKDTGKKYYVGDVVDFYCYLGGEEVNNPTDTLINSWWEYNADGYFPDSYIEKACADKIENLCKVCL